MTYQAPRHVWGIILPYLKQPDPHALSRPLRSSIRQDTLTRAMRLFAEICGPILYSQTLITDNLPSLLIGVENPATYKRLANIRNLKIEYSPKGDEAGYKILLSGDAKGWEGIGSDIGARALIRQQCREEARSIRLALIALNKIGGAAVFPHLETIAVASIYGAEHTKEWQALKEDRIIAKVGNRAVMVDYAMETVRLLKSLNLKHFCLRDAMSPIGLPTILDTYQDDPPNYGCTLHFNKDTTRFPIFLGTKIRWMLDDYDAEFELRDILENYSHHELEIIRGRWEVKRERNYTQRPVDVEMYCLTGAPKFRGKSDADWVAFEKTRAEELGKNTQVAMRHCSGVQDTYKWFTAAEIEPCIACGSGVPVTEMTWMDSDDEEPNE